jgi:integration host factor subunit alpha
MLPQADEKDSILNNPFFPQEHASMTLTKDHLISSIGNRLGVTKFESTRLVEFVLETIKTTLSNGEDVLISGFGKFSVRKKAPRKGRNPATGEALPLDAMTVVTFRCSPVMRERVNGKG